MPDQSFALWLRSPKAPNFYSNTSTDGQIEGERIEIMLCYNDRRNEKRTYRIDLTSFVGVPVGLDAVCNVEEARIAACCRRRASRIIQRE